jgi:hypothetical protein
MVLVQKQPRISFLNIRLLHYILECADWYLIGGVTCNGYGTGLDRMMKLAMTTLLADQVHPAISTFLIASLTFTKTA